MTKKKPPTEITFTIEPEGKSSYELLKFAAERGQLEWVHVLLNAGVPTETHNTSKSSQSMTPLMYAAGNGHLEVCHLLLEHEADVNVHSGMGETALFDALRGKHEDANKRWEIAKLLLDNGADISARDSNNRSALYYPFANLRMTHPFTDTHQSLVLVNQLIDYITEKRPNALKGIVNLNPKYETHSKSMLDLIYHQVPWRNFSEGDKELLKNVFVKLLDKGAVFDKTLQDAANDNNRIVFEIISGWCNEHDIPVRVTPKPRDGDKKKYSDELLIASKANNAERVGQLTNLADINHADSDGNTALHIAVQEGHIEVVKVLCTARILPNYSKTNKQGRTAMDIAMDMQASSEDKKWNDIVSLLSSLEMSHHVPVVQR